MTATAADWSGGQPNIGIAAPVDDTERRRLIAAAEEVLAGSSWTGLTLHSVLRRARLSTRSFYRHFDGKDDLLAALLEGELLAISDYLKLLCDEVSCPIERVWLYTEALIDLAFDQRIRKPASLFAVHWRKLLPENSTVVDRCTQALTAPLAQALNDGDRAGLLVCSDPAADARAILFLISGAVFDRPHTGGPDRRQLAERSLVPFVARALHIAPPARVPPRPRYPRAPDTAPAEPQFTLARYAWGER